MSQKQLVSIPKNNKSRKNNFSDKSPGQTTMNNKKSKMIKPQQPNSKKSRSARSVHNPSHQIKDNKKNRVQKNNYKDSKREETVKLEVQRILGGRFIDRPVVFSKDSK